jgi:2-polyprenyl-3-methyl-5-hydroxy-6-metoxy-1,4-benzoquinol methylase
MTGSEAGTLSHQAADTPVWDRIWAAEPSYHWDQLSLSIYETICRLTGELKGRRILEAGSGSGKISLCMAMDGAEVFLADCSEQALKMSELAFRRKARTAVFMKEDIRRLPLEGGSMDVCWNAGVLEHYERADRLSMLAEMVRVTRKGGRVIAFVPNAVCLPYRLGKAYAEKMGVWPYGVELPLHSMKEEFQLAGLEDIQEFDIAFDAGLDFLSFLPEAQTMKDVFREWADTLTGQEKQSLLQGYLIVTSGIVPA